MSDLTSLRTLYLCYFGLREPLVQTQVLPYLRQLALAGIKVHLLTFEPNLSESWGEDEVKKHETQPETEGIKRFHLPYHKSPSLPATLYDILAGARFAAALARRNRINVLHARAHVPMAMARLATRFVRAKLIFDIRGLMAEEYSDSGIWTQRVASVSAGQATGKGRHFTRGSDRCTHGTFARLVSCQQTQTRGPDPGHPLLCRLSTVRGYGNVHPERIGSLCSGLRWFAHGVISRRGDGAFLQSSEGSAAQRVPANLVSLATAARYYCAQKGGTR